MLQAALHPARAHGHPLASAIIRQTAEDFIVDEIPSATADGAGEHVWLTVRKKNSNTEYVAQQLAKLAKVRPVAVSYAGMKDRHAVTTQVFSVHIPGMTEPDWTQINSDLIEVIGVQRNSRKLRRGTLAGNAFALYLREFSCDAHLLEKRLTDIAEQGIPNYFGNQRFGRGGSNLLLAADLFSGSRQLKRAQRSYSLSAARSMLFNRVLEKRVADNNWNQALSGDICMRTGRHGFFTVDDDDQQIPLRIAAKEIHPSGPLWGKGSDISLREVLAIERKALAGLSSWCQGLENAGLKMERRALRVIPESMQWDYHDNTLALSFSLPAGCFATAVLREVADLKQVI